MNGPMLVGLPVFFVNISVLASKDYLEMTIFIARKTNSPRYMQTLSSAPLVLGQLSEKKHLVIFQYSDSLINVSSGNNAQYNEGSHLEHK